MKKWSCEELNLDNLPNNFLPVQFSDKARLPCSTIHFVSTFFADMNITSLTLVEMEGKTKIGLESNFQDPHYTNHLETGLQSTCKLRCSYSLVGL